MRLFFIHGLESNPNGSKVRKLRAQGFEVFAPDLHMGLMQFSKRNSALRNLLRSREMHVASGFSLALLLVGIWSSSWIAVASVAGFTTWLLIRRKDLFAKALARSFDACVQIARDALKEAKPVVLVGSSWGGAVAAELVATGAWNGPTILLAPAIEKVRTWTRRDDPTLLMRLRGNSDTMPIIVFHDPADDTVPHIDSVSLAQGSNIELRSVSAGGHRLLELLESGALATAIREISTVR